MTTFVNRWKEFFSNPIFKTININTNNDDVFNNTWDSLISFYSKANESDDFIFKLNEVGDYIYNELKDIFKEIRCRMDWGKQVCEIRRNEGVMINNSLSDIRETIKSILIEKNKSSINISPTFIDACLSNYCINDNCFPLKSDNKIVSSGSEIFNKIKEELGSSFKLEDLIICVFCVVNLSRNANNPPPIPYIDINNIWYELNHNNTIDLFNINSRFYKESFKLINKMNEFKDKIKEFLQTDIYINFNEIISKIGDQSNLSVEEMESDKLKIILCLDEIDKINAASTIGTLQYIDTLSKFNTTKIICDTDNVKDYNQFVNKYNFIDIVKGTKMN